MFITAGPARSGQPTDRVRPEAEVQTSPSSMGDLHGEDSTVTFENR